MTSGLTAGLGLAEQAPFQGIPGKDGPPGPPGISSGFGSITYSHIVAGQTDAP